MDTVIVPVTTLFGPFPVIEVGLQVVSAGKPLQVAVTAAVKPVEATMPTVVVPDPPGLAILTFAKPETAVNPGSIVKVTGAVLVLGLKLLSPW